MPDATAPTIAGYTIEALIGQGGSSSVWRATGPQGTVAIKVGTEPAITARSEWRMLRRHAGPHVVEALDLTTSAEGHSALVLEYMAGGSLDDVVRGRGGLTVGECVTALAPVAATMAGFHDRGCVHADLTPSNILFDHQGRPAIADLGATRVAARADGADWATYGFVAPEIVDGEPPSAAADVYSFGALAWFCLLGTPPPVAALRPHLVDVLPDAPDALVDLITACLAQTPSSRPHAAELATRLRGVATARPVPVPTAVPIGEGSDTPAVGESITRRLRDEAQRRQFLEPADAERHGSSLRGGRRGRRGRRGAETRGEVGGRRTWRPGAVDAGRRADAAGARWRAGRWVPAALLGACVVTAAAMWPVHAGGDSANDAGSSTSAAYARANPGVTPANSTSSSTTVTPAPPSKTMPNAVSPSTNPEAGTAVPASGAKTPTMTAPTRQEVVALLDCRAKAWSTLDREGLGRCLVPGSAAHTHDLQAFTRASAQGASYDGLGYAIGALTPTSCSGGQVCLTSRITTSGYDVRTKTASERVAARHDDVRLVLSHDGTGWRISSWSAS